MLNWNTISMTRKVVAAICGAISLASFGFAAGSAVQLRADKRSVNELLDTCGYDAEWDGNYVTAVRKDPKD